MKKLLIRWLALAIATIAASFVSQALGLGFQVDASTTGHFLQLLIGVAILAALNATLGRILKFLTIPLNCLTFGLVSVVINALMLWAAAGTGYGMKVTGSGMQAFIAALVASILISVFNGVLNSLFPSDKDRDKDADD